MGDRRGPVGCFEAGGELSDVNEVVSLDEVGGRRLADVEGGECYIWGEGGGGREEGGRDVASVEGVGWVGGCEALEEESCACCEVCDVCVWGQMGSERWVD